MLRKFVTEGRDLEMEKPERLLPIDAAHKFVDTYFPDCGAALLAGSTVRGEATATSDLDIVIFDSGLPTAYWESMIEHGWSIEIFVHNEVSYREFFEKDRERARPSLPRMISEGVQLKDNGILAEIKKESVQLLERGPEKWSAETIDMKRYFITDTLHDFIGCEVRAEGLFIANALADLLSEFFLRTNRQWIGTSKWIVRALKNYNADVADAFDSAFDSYYRSDDKSKVIRLADEILDPHGGRLFAGFSIGKN